LPITFLVRHCSFCILFKTDNQGSPLNRVSFLRPDHTFLSQALKHPSSAFLLFNNLDPLVHSPDKLAQRKYADVKSIIGDDPFHHSEEETIAQYNSSLYLPQIVFLGLDERHSGFDYKGRYKGQPWFAVDITPKESVQEAAEALVISLKAEGLDFSKGRMNMNLPAEQGNFKPYIYMPNTNPPQPPSTPKRATSWTGTRATPSAPRAATKRCPSTPASNAPVHPKTSPPP
jgi:hypothetical protein